MINRRDIMHRICVVLFGLLWLRRSVAFQICGMVIKPSFKLRSQLLAMSSNLEIIGQSISKSIGKIYRPAQWIGGYGGGGSGASTGNIVDDIGTKFFVKQGNLYSYNMLNAEYEAISEIYRSNTIRVPRPICIDTSDSNVFVVFEYLAVGGTADPVEYAKKLVAMHRVTSPNGMFGWKMNNTIGATFQPNTYTENWATFWDTHRLGHMLDLARREGAYFGNEVELRAKVKALLSKHNCQPSLVHGDLWSGNQGCLATGEPVIFDPAAYFGDREVDIAMTKLFGSNANKFYSEYNALWPLPPGWELRETIYNLYHILNHYVLFGGSYQTQAQRMIDKIMKA